MESKFKITSIGMVCLKCGANSVDVDTRHESEDCYVEEYSCRLCGYAEDHYHDI
ncbi:hypothetical protein [Photobacterium leiognathi]|uniref:hypothetical protein n=1 Tax=Photobacterium leiognathi TaxID=553611 RepID=UPI0027390577|nr:hypothetical protein [Photobacterium leiognathi]